MSSTSKDWALGFLSELRKRRKEALQTVFADLQQSFREGDKTALLKTMFHHLHWREPLPEWARDAFIEAISFQPKCWDDVFGKPDGKGAQRKEEVKAFYAASDNPEKDHDDLFEDIATKIRKSIGTAKRRYYSDTRERLEAGEDALNHFRSEFGLSIEELREWQNEIYWYAHCIIVQLQSSQKTAED